ncbi:MAG: response regulator transcription factor [Spirochaetales bacterium]|nr:response regulator transcription factor [Spirochaetales bacterium]
MPITSIMLVEDHPIFRKGLASLISTESIYQIVGEAQNSAEAIEILSSKKPVLAIVDLKLGDEDGLELIKLLKSINPDLKIIVLSMSDERFYAERALKAGALGYIMKEEAGIKVLNAIKTVLSGRIWLSDSEKERLSEYNLYSEDYSTSLKKLSDRQLQIFCLIGKGYGSLEISEKLNISRKTVDTHKENIKIKLNCNTSKDLRQLAIEFSI